MPNPVVHFEIGCQDREATEKFYADLFGWSVLREGAASMISAEEGGIAGHITALGHEPNHYVTFYVETSDLAKTLAKAEQLGGRTVMPPMEMGGVSFALFADPEGLVIGLAQRAAPAPRKRTVRKAVKKTAKHATARKNTTRTRRRR